MADYLVVDRLEKRFTSHGRAAFRDITFSVGQGEFVALIGPSGCGKSTLLHIMAGLSQPTSGAIRLAGEDISEPRPEMMFVFQQYTKSIFPWKTVLENVRLGVKYQSNVSRQALEKICLEHLDLVGLGRYPHYYPYQLSGGMQQRVAIARALVFSPDILLMDEPFGALDEITRAAMRYELLRIWEQATSTVVFVTHSIAEAIILSDFVVVVARQPGRIREVVPIDLPRPRDEAMEYGARFLEYAAHLKGLLR